MHAILIAALSFAPPDVKGFEATASYVVHNAEGWKVLVHPHLAKKQPALVEEVLTLLRHQLYQVKRVVPEDAVAKLQAVPFWVENFHPLHACMCYHPSAGWLREKGCNADKAKAVEIANPKNFLAWTKQQPYMVLHELAHAYHHQFLPDGYDNRDIHKIFVRMKESKKYDSILHIDGSKRKHYALTTPMEYFAESSEAFFGTNDFYPFVRSELREFDRDMFDLLERMWLKKEPKSR